MTTLILTSGNLTIAAAVVIFLVLTLLLVAVLLIAKARLMPAGNRRITINGERTVETHRASIYRKLHIKTASELMTFCKRMQI